MRHQLRKRSSFGLKPGPREALLKGLVYSLVHHERIKTTLPKAREAKRRAERALSIAKKGGAPRFRLLLSRYPQKSCVSKLMEDLAPRFKERKGGCTRIIKLGKRSGDSAEMAYLEWVDYDPSASKKTKAKKPKDETSKDSKKQKASKKSPEKRAEKKAFKLKKKRKKHLRKIKQASRRRNRDQ